ncbi:MAG: hypothetical protein ACRCSK_05395, partial [Fusobacteriaceae bacterium]
MKKRKFNIPSSYAILFILTCLVAALTWIIPAGTYSYIDPTAEILESKIGTYQIVDQNPQGLWEVLIAPVRGFSDVSKIILFIFSLGGFISVIMKTGSIDAWISHVLKKLKGKEFWLIPIMVSIFAIGGTTFGLAEETLAFYAFLTPVILGLGFDTITTMGIILLGSGIGCINSTVNPFIVGQASWIAGISIIDGIFLRILMLIIQVVLVSMMLVAYVKKIKQNPESSCVYETHEEDLEFFLTGEEEKKAKNKKESKEEKHHHAHELTSKRKKVLWMFCFTFFLMVIGIIPWMEKFNIPTFENLANYFRQIPYIGKFFGVITPFGGWGFEEMTLLFLVASFIIGNIYGMREKEIAHFFIDGAKDFIGVAFLLSFAKGIVIIMTDGEIIATVLHFGETNLVNLGQ